MRLLSANVGQPQTIVWRGRPVRSAIWTAPVAGRRRVRVLNVDGDAQADLVGHGGEHRAVFVYQVESYRCWERELRRELTAMGGQFGENFTVEGLADDEVWIGDRFAIGSALFEVTQPRVTCVKVGIPAGRAAHARAADRPRSAGLTCASPAPLPTNGRGWTSTPRAGSPPAT